MPWPPTDQAPVPALDRIATQQARKPRERNLDAAPVRRFDAQAVGRNLHALGIGLTTFNGRNSHTMLQQSNAVLDKQPVDPGDRDRVQTAIMLKLQRVEPEFRDAIFVFDMNVAWLPGSSNLCDNVVYT